MLVLVGEKDYLLYVYSRYNGLQNNSKIIHFYIYLCERINIPVITNPVSTNQK